MTTVDACGPIDVLVLEFPEHEPGTSTAKAVQELIDQGTIHLYDLLIVHKNVDGSYAEIDLRESTQQADLADWKAFNGARSGLLDADDIRATASILEPDTTAAVVLYENAWAAPFVAAARSEGAEMVASVRLSAQEIMDDLDQIETEEVI